MFACRSYRKNYLLNTNPKKDILEGARGSFLLLYEKMMVLLHHSIVFNSETKGSIERSSQEEARAITGSQYTTYLCGYIARQLEWASKSRASKQASNLTYLL